MTGGFSNEKHENFPPQLSAGSCRLLCRRGPDGLLRQHRACFVCFHRPGAPASSAASEVTAAPFLTVEDFPALDGSTACIP